MRDLRSGIPECSGFAGAVSTLTRRSAPYLVSKPTVLHMRPLVQHGGQWARRWGPQRLLNVTPKTFLPSSAQDSRGGLCRR